MMDRRRSPGPLSGRGALPRVWDGPRSETDLRRRERQLAAAESLAQLGSWEWDLAADRVRWSDELYRIWGMSPAAAAPGIETYLHRVHPDDAALVRSTFDRALERCVPFDFTHRIVRSDGTRWIHCRGQVVCDGGEPCLLRAVAQDVTAYRVELERANAARAQFLASMSHELRTPLNAIAGYSELLELGIPGELNLEQREIIGRVQRNQRRLLGLINDILNFTRLTGTRVQFPLLPVAVAPVLVGLEQLVGPELARKQIDYRCEPVAASVRVLTNIERLEQLLLNLLSNAIKFTAPGGSVRVHTRATADRVSIAIEDSGRGIPPSQQVAIFGPFVQVDPEPARDNAGVGLGLAISRELARAMRAEIEVHSEPDRGATFTVQLPRA